MITLNGILELLDLAEKQMGLVSLRQSKRAKRLIFKASISNGFEIVLPNFYDDKWVIETIVKRKTKIEDQIALIIESRMELKPVSITLPPTKETWSVIYGTLKRDAPDNIVEANGRLELADKCDDVFWGPTVLQNWLHIKATEYLPQRLDMVSRKLGLPYNKVTIKRQKTRWGSCSIRRNINLNRNLMLMRGDVVDYILHHELVHLKVLNHSSKFWSELEEAFPSYKESLLRLRNFERNELPKWALT